MRDEAYDFFSSHFLKQAQSGLRAYPDGIKASTPFNASPYVASLTDLSALATTQRRSDLLDAFKSSIIEASSIGANVKFALIGGSFLDIDLVPKDMDCVFFYALDGAIGNTEVLSGFQSNWKSKGIDLRFVPVDSDLIVAFKVGIFFSTLYAQSRHNDGLVRGSVLVRMD